MITNSTLLINAVKRLLNKEVKLEEMKLDNGTVIEAEVFEAESPVFIVTEDEKVPLPVGDYTLEDGRMLTIAEEGIIAEVKAATEEVEVEAGAEEPTYVTKAELDSAIGEIKSMLSTHFETQKADEGEEAPKAEEAVQTDLSADEAAAESIKPNPDRGVEKAPVIKLAENTPMSTTDRMIANLNKINNN